MAHYVQQSLGDQETVLVEGRFPPIYWVGAWATLILLGPLLIGIYLFARWAINMKTTEFAVTDHRVVLKRGLLKRTTQEIAIDTVEGVELVQSLWGRLFGYGRIAVRGTGEAIVQFPNMTEPVAFRKAIDRGRDHAHLLHFDDRAVEQLGEAAAAG